MKFLKWVNIVLLVLAISACGAPVIEAGQVTAVQAGTTLFHLNQAVTGQVGHYILMNGENICFVWGMENGIGFTMITTEGHWLTEWQKATAGQGMTVGWKDAQGFVQFLRDNGWKSVSALQVPTYVSVGIQRAYAAFQSSSPIYKNFLRGAVVVIIPAAVMSTSTNADMQNWMIEEYAGEWE